MSAEDGKRLFLYHDLRSSIVFSTTILTRGYNNKIVLYCIFCVAYLIEMSHCACGRYFDTEQAFNQHWRDSHATPQGQRTTYKEKRGKRQHTENSRKTWLWDDVDMLNSKRSIAQSSLTCSTQSIAGPPADSDSLSALVGSRLSRRWRRRSTVHEI